MAQAYVEIPLSGEKAAGRVALIDIDDYEIVIHRRWFVWEYPNRSGRMAGPYAHTKRVRADGKRTNIGMHTLIARHRKVDHRNGDGLDNRQANLRDGSGGINERNARKRIDGSSQFKGVSRHEQRGAWRARIQFNGKPVFLGHFNDETEAATAYDAAAKELFGEAAVLNFPA